ncbi:MAG: FeS-binding protein [SAR202 cluster bacterium]|nr:FeS-binding protein [SAR202 cluster bacterium]|tara:strand:+ start:844 stop:1086 length:243 start_codon:yes stop_codon:yes gene_type:complete
MAQAKFRFTFPQDLVTEPIIYNLGRNFELITNIRRANVTDDQGWVILELEGDQDEIERGIAWVTENKVRVDPISGDVIEG